MIIATPSNTQRILVTLSLALVLFSAISQALAEEELSFTHDWVSVNVKHWRETLKQFQGKPDIHMLEVGSQEGRSAIWFLENILTHPSSTITCVDVFHPNHESRFDNNIRISGYGAKVIKKKGYSQEVLPVLPSASFDIIYIDGCHDASCVLTDAIYAWSLLKVNGVLIFDDFLHRLDLPTHRRPKIAIDAFLESFRPYIKILHIRYQVIVQKKSDSSNVAR